MCYPTHCASNTALSHPVPLRIVHVGRSTCHAISGRGWVKWSPATSV
jgi:hypothetical protein